MIIKWIFEDIKPGQIRGPLATSEDGNYQIVFESKSIYFFTYYLYKNSDCIYDFDFCTIDYFDLSDLLVKCHRKIERYDKYYHLDQLSDSECTVKFKENICGTCHHLIFKDFRHREGLCNLCRLHRCFDDPCVHEEEMS